MISSFRSFAAYCSDLAKLPFKFVITFLFMASASIVGGQTLQTLCSLNCLNGAYPSALTLGNDGNFYGSTDNGGFGYIYDATMFKVTTNGTLTSFNNSSGGDAAGLTLGTDGNFYGTTRYGGQGDLGGDDGDGTVFMMTTNGTITRLYFFTDGLDVEGSVRGIVIEGSVRGIVISASICGPRRLRLGLAAPQCYFRELRTFGKVSSPLFPLFAPVQNLWLRLAAL